MFSWDSLSGSVVKNPPANAGDASLIPGSARSPEEGNGNPVYGLITLNLLDLICSKKLSRARPGWETGNPLQYSCLGNHTEKPSGLQSMGLQESDMT